LGGGTSNETQKPVSSVSATEENPHPSENPKSKKPRELYTPEKNKPGPKGGGDTRVNEAPGIERKGVGGQGLSTREVPLVGLKGKHTAYKFRRRITTGGRQKRFRGGLGGK